MSAHPVPAGALVLAFAVTTALAWLAAGRRRGAGFIGTGLLAVQGVLHLTFLGGGHHGRPPGTPHAMPAGTAHAVPAGSHGMAHPPAPGVAVTAPAHGPGSEAADLVMALTGGASAGMVAAHLLAAAVCAVWLARGEAAFFRLARALGALAFTPLRLLLTALVLLPEPPRPPRPRPRDARRHQGRALAHALSRRGPPALAVPRATVPGATHV
ncbi:hypothetical protein [Streptomyces sp. NPDC015131]|uniref:hypothetical protein n=1 Tax=Streptomyces sp. NPDC015131 TaxID=3364941 RepID=UPI003701E353